MQNTVASENAVAYEGMLHGRPARIKTAIADEMIYFGKAISISPTVDIDDIPPTARRFTSGETFLGVSIADTTLERLAHPTTGEADGAPYGAFADEAPFGVLQDGQIWVVSDTAVDSLAKTVYVKNTDTAGTQAYIETTLVPAKTAATIATDVMSLAAIATDTMVVTVAGFAAVTVTFGAGTDSQAEVIADLNAALAGIAVATAVSTTGVLLTTVAKGTGITIACTDIAGELEWAAAVAGTTPNLTGDHIDVLVPGYASQLLTFTSNEVDIDSIVSKINTLRGVKATKESATKIRITTDKYGSDQTITVTDVAGELTWDTPVAGTGDISIYAENARGSFRCYTASQSVSGYTELSTSVAKWIRGVTISGKYFGLLDLNVRQ